MPLQLISWTLLLFKLKEHFPSLPLLKDTMFKNLKTARSTLMKCKKKNMKVMKTLLKLKNYNKIKADEWKLKT